MATFWFIWNADRTVRKSSMQNVYMVYLIASNQTRLWEATYINIARWVKNIPTQGQAVVLNDGIIWTFDVNGAWDNIAKFMIQENLSFDHIDNTCMTKFNQDTLQPCSEHVSQMSLDEIVLMCGKRLKFKLFYELKT